MDDYARKLGLFIFFRRTTISPFRFRVVFFVSGFRVGTRLKLVSGHLLSRLYSSTSSSRLEERCATGIQSRITAFFSSRILPPSWQPRKPSSLGFPVEYTSKPTQTGF